MVKLEVLIKQKKISKINELELFRYVNFFENSYKENLEHSIFIKNEFSRWSIISGYYAMHDITKLLLAKNFRIKIEFEVHATTIKVLRELIKNKELLTLIEKGYGEFITLANDLAEAKKERVKSQYYTGTDFMKKEYQKKASKFLEEVVAPYLEKIKILIKEK
ncbi:MAG: hypothetical protein ABIC91_06685 [Nanoarchaeota archaeon]|nr:hypothetical protein [Nanoarchaeota archaeon]MBU1029680.1 hypothetical protein [Nanoarchaeota archaeon]MBU1849295.1 hypothetical protein [Nanoarchaeota archaeon]